jgi:succinate-semialdehyde dehydrogenase/glutarate-semialdehyde dehydrogenase
MTVAAAPRDYADPALHAPGLWIGGHWLHGSGIPVTNPSTGLLLAEVTDAGIAEAILAVDAAEAAAGWRATAPRQRSEILRQKFTRMTKEAEASRI